MMQIFANIYMNTYGEMSSLIWLMAWFLLCAMRPMPLSKPLIIYIWLSTKEQKNWIDMHIFSVKKFLYEMAAILFWPQWININWYFHKKGNLDFLALRRLSVWDGAPNKVPECKECQDCNFFPFEE